MSLLTDITNGAKNTLEGLVFNNVGQYVSIIHDLQKFRGSGRAEEDYYDFPNQTYFKVLFHFFNDSDAITGAPGATGADSVDQSSDTGTGLLHPTWLKFGGLFKQIIGSNRWTNMLFDDPAISSAQRDLESLWNYNSAWAYLVMNNEIQRAQNLQSMVEILSNINRHTPWYFQKINGLEAATQRSMVNGEIDLKTDRNKITIECLPDAYDNRISTFLDLYRSVAWSWETKRMILPSNLRKFDMTILTFQMPTKGQNVPREIRAPTEASIRQDVKLIETPVGFAVAYDTPGIGSSLKLASYKAWEFHGCEFDYNSKSVDTLDNVEGTSIQTNIDIFYDDCFEIRFNEFLGRHVSDLMGDDEPMKIGSDLSATPIYPLRDKNGTPNELPDVKASNIMEYISPNGQLANRFRKIYLGNLLGLSLRAGNQLIQEKTKPKSSSKKKLGNISGTSKKPSFDTLSNS